MAPFYEIEPTKKPRRVYRGETVELRQPGPKRSIQINIWDDDLALVKTPENTFVVVGKLSSKEKIENPERLTGEFILNKESVMTNARQFRGLVWKKK